MKYAEPDASMASIYASAGYQLLPLHFPSDTSSHKGKVRQDGKRPLHSNWTKRRYVNSDVLSEMEAGRNIGVRLKADQLVVDVDPRNMPEGRDTFKELCEEVDLDVSRYPVVITGSGGLHVYMRKPADVKLVDSLEDFPGVEFKSEGRQVVSAGSVHPETGRLYEWDEFDYSEEELTGYEPEAPSSLIILARRPTISATSQGHGGEYDQEEIAKMLESLDPENFKEQDKWLTLMQAVHHASGGDARSEFIEWSTRDPEYSEDSWIIGRRWDSLSVNRSEGQVTYRTLHKFMRDVNRHAEIIRPDDPDEDFGDDDEFDDLDLPEGAKHEKKTPLDKMNDEFIVVSDEGKVVVMGHAYNPATKRTYWNRWTRSDFNFYLANRHIMVADKDGEMKLKPVTDEWYSWGKRRTAKGVLFDPEHDHEGYLNLWQGWNYEPKKGSWDYLKDLILNVLCDGDQASYNYVYKWMAHMVQHPGSPAEVAIAFHGAKGTGKSTLGNILCKLAGSHGLAVSSPDQITGRFKSHLQDCLMLFADEAIRPHDRGAEAMLKTLITEEWLAIEGKGVNLKTAKNHIHLMLASNDAWFLPASFGDGERRFFVSKVNSSRQGDKKFFNALHKEMDNGGFEAMLYELSTFNLGSWVPRDNIPKTSALAEQQIRNMSPIEQWWYTLLNSGDLSGIDGAIVDPLRMSNPMGWASGAWLDIARPDLRSSFDMFCRKYGINPGASGRSLETLFAHELRKICPSIPVKQIKVTIPEERIDLFAPDGRTTAYRIPPLGLCRQEFEAVAGFTVPWEDEDFSVEFDGDDAFPDA